MPRSHRVAVAGPKLYVYAAQELKERFQLPATDQKHFTAAKASTALVQLFQNHGYKLAAAAPITAQDGHEITPDIGTAQLGRASYPTLRVHPGPDGTLPVYGSGKVRLRDWAREIDEYAFGPTTALDAVLDRSSLGPSGFPVAAYRDKAMTWRQLVTARAAALCRYQPTVTHRDRSGGERGGHGEVSTQGSAKVACPRRNEMSAKKQMPHENPQHMEWRKSSHSTGNGACVEVAPAEDGRIALRDSKAPNGPVMRFTEHEWSAFVHGVRDGEFDHMV